MARVVVTRAFMLNLECMKESVDAAALTGAAYIKDFASRLGGEPGVYRMLGQSGKVLYVGKARNLKKRVMSYAVKGALPARTLRMIAQTTQMEVIITRSEAEALLLEASLIKQLAPTYNILLRDDKSYPFVFLGGDHDYPQITKHRGAQKRKGRYFGPFASVNALNQTLAILQRAFLLRPCPDTVFAHRSRPCLQYQIKRCSAPCVGRIAKEDYAELVKQAEAFLSGKSREVQEELREKMLEYSAAQDYEKAAQCRDRIRALTQVQQEQALAGAEIADADVIGLWREGGSCCIQVFFFRGGRTFGNRAFFPAIVPEQENAEILEAFLGQFYQGHPAPSELILSETPADAQVLAEALHLKEQRPVHLHVPKRGTKRQLIEQVCANARMALGMHLAERRSEEKHLAAVAERFGLDEPPARIEVYDNSHIMGTHAVGAMITATAEGFEKKSYRRFTIRHGELTPGDDYGMTREVFFRRFSRLQKEDPGRTGGGWPDLVLIDGGAGQLSAARGVMEELGLADLPLVAIAKGPDRNAGREQFFLPGKEPFTLPSHDPLMHYLQRLRDEAHRFAISSHRIKRANALRASELDAIPGIGPGRKKALLHHFGSAKAVEGATLEELQKAPGINKRTAQQIHDYFRGA